MSRLPPTLLRPLENAAAKKLPQQLIFAGKKPRSARVTQHDSEMDALPRQSIDGPSFSPARRSRKPP